MKHLVLKFQDTCLLINRCLKFFLLYVIVNYVYAESLNNIIVFINKNVITSNQLERQIKIEMGNLQMNGFKINSISKEDLKKQVLDQMILETIQLDFATKNGIRTNDSEINSAFNTMINNSHSTIEEFQKKLKDAGMSLEVFKERIKKQIIIEKLRQKDVDNRIIVSDDEVNRVMASESYKKQVQYNLSMILVAVPEGANSDQIDKKHSEILKAHHDLKSGLAFSQVAIKYSNATNALQGGALGWKSNLSLPPFILDAIKDLHKDEYSEVINSPMGFLIFKVNDIKDNRISNVVRQYHIRQILVKVNEFTNEKEALAKIKKIQLSLNELTNTSLIESQFIKFANEYSQDSSSLKGGDMGWISSDGNNQFETTIRNLSINSISNPIRSPLGWHLIQMVGIKDSANSEKEKNDVRQSLHENKVNIFYAQWLHDLRNAAYLKYND